MQTEELQRDLLAWGFDVGKVDGDFAPATWACFKAFHRKLGLSDGIGPGPQTIAALMTAQPVEQHMSVVGLVDCARRSPPDGTSRASAYGRSALGIPQRLGCRPHNGA